MATGGNKKTSSPSDINYWKRAQMGGFATTHKDRNHARHNKRMGLDPKYAQNRVGGPDPAKGRGKPKTNEYSSIFNR